ncbi:MAG: hypothetical protein HQ507_02090 [Candidatus Marinimicrobia bacterium]|nr:hypothetical protein [Candidatus Neomarinimicrobiota bacterium]
MGSSYNLIIALVSIILFVILGYKIWQNTKLMRSSGVSSLKEKSENMMHDFLDQPKLWAKLAKGEQPDSPEENANMFLLVSAAVREFENQCSEYEKGLLEDHEWETLQESIASFTSMPGVKKYWLELKADMSVLLQSVVESHQ